MAKTPDDPNLPGDDLPQKPAGQLDMFSQFFEQAEPDIPSPDPCFPDLIWFPHINGSERSGSATSLGLSGEYVVMAEAIRHGFEAYLAHGGLSHDIRAAWKRISWRIQVKAVTFPTNGSYTVNLQKGYRNSPQGRRGYDADAFDMVAVVILPLNVVIFTCQRDAQIRIGVDEVRYAQAHPGNSFRTAFLEMLGNPALGQVPDRAALKLAFEAEWQRRHQRHGRQNQLAAPAVPVALSKQAVWELIGRWAEEAEHEQFLLDMAADDLCWDDDDEALEAA